MLQIRLTTLCIAGAVGASIFYTVSARAENYTLLHVFPQHAKGGFDPNGVTLGDHGVVYGTTFLGGKAKQGQDTCFGNSNSCGTIFRLNPDGALKVLHTFSGSDGAQPSTTLVRRRNMLYGAAASGGSGSGGTLFSIRSDGSDFTILHSFQTGYGVSPGNIAIDSNDTIYGGAGCTTVSGGCGGNALIYRLLKDGTYSVLYTLPTRGAYVSGLTVGTDGNLVFSQTDDSIYGTFGNVSEYNIATGEITVLYKQKNSGVYLVATDQAGDLFAYTQLEKAPYDGQVIELVKSDVGYTKELLWQFHSSASYYEYPISLSLFNDGSLVGTTTQYYPSTGEEGGSLFTLTGGNLQTLYQSCSPSGAILSGAPVQMHNGQIIGSAEAGGDPTCAPGTDSGGVIYSYKP